MLPMLPTKRADIESIPTALPQIQRTREYNKQFTFTHIRCKNSANYPENSKIIRIFVTRLTYCVIYVIIYIKIKMQGDSYAKGKNSRR